MKLILFSNAILFINGIASDKGDFAAVKEALDDIDTSKIAERIGKIDINKPIEDPKELAKSFGLDVFFKLVQSQFKKSSYSTSGKLKAFAVQLYSAMLTKSDNLKEESILNICKYFKSIVDPNYGNKKVRDSIKAFKEAYKSDIAKIRESDNGLVEEINEFINKFVTKNDELFKAIAKFACKNEGNEVGYTIKYLFSLFAELNQEIDQSINTVVGDSYKCMKASYAI